MTAVGSSGLRVRRRIRRVGVGALLGLAVWALAGVPFLVLPASDPLPRHADVVLVLGPPVALRVEVAERLLRDHVVDAALVSVPYEEVPHGLRALCSRADVTCADPDPRTTRGEARMLRADARRKGWSSAIVVTMPAHVTRARTLVSRCFGGPLTVVGDTEGPYGGWAYQYAYQTAATVKAWWLQGC